MVRPRRLIPTALCILIGGAAVGITDAKPTTAPSASRPADVVGERVPSEDPAIKDLHSMGLLDGRVDVFRSACPVRDIAKRMSTAQPPTTRPTADQLAEAVARLRHLHDDLGVRTDVSFQDPDQPGEEGKVSDVAAAVALERKACDAVGIRYVSRPIANAGPNSLQTMTDRQVLDLVDPIAAEILADARTGGVLFHCSAGHDRTGLVAAYLRMKVQHWPADQADDEMRRLGHNWPKYSADGGVSSWHEAHLRGLADLIDHPGPTTR